MQRIIVDLPEPEGPQTTTRSPFFTTRFDVVEHVELAEPFVDVAHLDHRLCRRAPVVLGHRPRSPAGFG
jgi:hypothetical protein